MRTTLDIDDDILAAVKEIAEVRRSTAGKVISDLARKGLQPAPQTVRIKNGVPLFPPRPPGSPVITVEMIKRLQEDEDE